MSYRGYEEDRVAFEEHYRFQNWVEAWGLVGRAYWLDTEIAKHCEIACRPRLWMNVLPSQWAIITGRRLSS